MSPEALKTQLRLANAFGLVARLGNRNWRTPYIPHEEATERVHAKIRKWIDADTAARAANLAMTFRGMLNMNENDGASPLSIIGFRVAIVRLVEQGRIAVSGGSPSGNAVKLRVLLRAKNADVEVREIDLGRGDFLVPGKPSVVATLQGAT